MGIHTDIIGKVECPFCQKKQKINLELKSLAAGWGKYKTGDKIIGGPYIDGIYGGIIYNCANCHDEILPTFKMKNDIISNLELKPKDFNEEFLKSYYLPGSLYESHLDNEKTLLKILRKQILNLSFNLILDSSTILKRRLSLDGSDYFYSENSPKSKGKVIEKPGYTSWLYYVDLKYTYEGGTYSDGVIFDEFYIIIDYLKYLFSISPHFHQDIIELIKDLDIKDDDFSDHSEWGNNGFYNGFNEDQVRYLARLYNSDLKKMIAGIGFDISHIYEGQIKDELPDY